MLQPESGCLSTEQVSRVHVDQEDFSVSHKRNEIRKRNSSGWLILGRRYYDSENKK
jgi:hypothetical protein